MRNMMLISLIVALVAILLPCGAIASPFHHEQAAALSNMTVAELEAKGDELRGQKEYKDAIEHYQNALRKDRNNALLYNKIGLAQLQLHEFRRAQTAFDKAVKLNPKYAPAFNNLGLANHLQRRYDSAVKNYKKALALNEADAVFHCNLGGAWFALNQFERAVAEYQRGLELDPDVLARIQQGGVVAQISSPEDRAKFSYMMAKLYAKRGDLDRAIQSLKKAKEEGYSGMNDVYKDAEFASLQQDARLAEVVPPRKK
jgi:tetratricopeptide (TPR) repeat protein